VLSRTLVVAWVAKLGGESAVERILQTMIPLTRAEPGCIRYEVFRAVEDPRRFLLVEVYKDDAALQTHTDSDHFKRYVLGEALALLESRERVGYEPLS
jgi:quinol monooxygenase YgiN